MNRLCGCCTGIEVLTPETEANRPGLSAIAYRAGTFATFYETMVARLSNLYIDVPSPDGTDAMQRIYPLRQLTTREPSDFSIALLEAWSTVGDVLTFYQERIANEGFLGTATERLSVLDLARLIGYKLRPGVSASVFLAFTAADAFKGTIPAGTRAQSIPGTGEKPQFFETSVDLAARDVWNDLGVRLTRPQAITLVSDARTNTQKPAVIDQGTDAATRDTLYFQGISTNLKVGDMLLVVSGTGTGQQATRFVASVSAEASENRTEVTLQPAPLTIDVLSADKLRAVLTPYIEDSSNLFAGSSLAAQVAGILSSLLAQAKDPASDLASLVQGGIEQVTEKHEIAVKRDFTRLEPWTADLLNALNELARAPQHTGGPPPAPPSTPSGVKAAPRGLGNLFAIVNRLALPPNPQPANSLRLGRSVAQAFLAQSDIAPRLLAAFNPRAATTLYDAWAAIPTAPTPIQVFAMRSKGSAFGNNAPKQILLEYTTQSGSEVTDVTQTPTEWNLSSTDLNNPTGFSMDSLNDKIMPGDWVVVTRTDANATTANSSVIAQVKSTQPLSRADYGMSARITQLTLSKQWLVVPSQPTPDISILRGATLFAQPEELQLAEEPLDRDVEGNTIELDGLYDGLEAGRWVIVSGKRTDVTDSTGATSSTGVTGTELVMLAAVNQGPGKQSCAALTVGSVPFDRVYYLTDHNDAGDRLVVARPTAALAALLNDLPLPNTADDHQQICDPIELAPGLYANIYLPTADERLGKFSDFTGLLTDPFDPNNKEFPGGQIPIDRRDPKAKQPIWAWRITTIASGQDTPHTNLVLANSLAYSYDSASVTLYGNVVKATHGQTVGEVLGDGDSSQSLQQFTLGQSPLTYVASPTPEGAASTLLVRVNEIEWHEANDLAGLGPSDREYVTETDDAGKTSVVFGTGEHGRRLPTGSSNVKATYRYGIGKSGNVTAQKISQLASQPLGVKGVINPLEASGGADADSRDQARRNAPLAVGALDRLVSVEDYELFARTFAGIGKARSVRLSDGRRLTVHLTIAGLDDIPIDLNSDLYQNLVLALQQNGDPHQPVQVALRRLKLLVMSAAVKLLPDYAWESVEPAIRDVLLTTFGFDQRDLGQSAFLSEAISAIQNVEGVSYVNVTTFDSVAEDITAEELAALASTLGLQKVVQANLAQVDPAQADPDNRILPAEVAILKPDISDTLILTQITA